MHIHEVLPQKANCYLSNHLHLTVKKGNKNKLKNEH